MLDVVRIGRASTTSTVASRGAAVAGSSEGTSPTSAPWMTAWFLICVPLVALPSTRAVYTNVAEAPGASAPKLADIVRDAASKVSPEPAAGATSVRDADNTSVSVSPISGDECGCCASIAR